MGDAAQRDRVVAQFREMSPVVRDRELKAQVLHAGFDNGRLKAAYLRLPLGPDIEAQRAVENEALPLHSGNPADQ